MKKLLILLLLILLLPSVNATNISSCGVISSAGVYTLNQSITNIASGTCIDITTNDVILDGQGFTIDGKDVVSTYGIYVYNSGITLTNVTVKNLVVTDWNHGIYYRNAQNGSIVNNTVTSNNNGIFLYFFSNNNTLTNNTAISNNDGIYIYSSSNNNTLTNNILNSNNYGIDISYSNNNTITNNTASSNSYAGIILSFSNNNTITNNTATSDTTGIYIRLSSNNNILTNNIIKSNNYGFYLENSSNITIYNNFFNNTNNSYLSGTIYANTWNTTKTLSKNIVGGSFLGGNFWANPNGTGFSQTCEDLDYDGICDSAYNITTSNVDFLPLNINFTTTNYYTTTIYETVSYSYNLSIEKPPVLSIINISAILWWNGTAYTNTSFFQNSTHINIGRQLTTPLLSSITQNNTNVSHFWQYNISYVDGSYASFNTSSNNQSILLAYYLQSGFNNQTQSAVNVSEGEYFYNYLNATALYNYATLRAYSTWRSVNSTATAYQYNNFSTYLNAGNLSGLGVNNATFTVNSTLNVTFGGTSRLQMSENDNVTVWQILITNCTAPYNVSPFNTTTLRFFFKDEENATNSIATSAASNVSMEINMQIFKSNQYYATFNATYSNIINNVTLCLYPSMASYSVTATILHRAANYAPSSRFLNTTLTNTTQNVTLYSLLSSKASVINIYVIDSANIPQPNRQIRAMRSYIGENLYREVRDCITNYEEGVCPIYLNVLDAYYYFIVQYNDTVEVTTLPSQITCNSYKQQTLCPPYPIPIIIGALSQPKFAKVLGKYSVDCTDEDYAKANGIIRCTLIDNSGVNTYSHFVVEKMGAVTWTTICDSTSTDTVVTYVCNLGNITDTMYKYRLEGIGSPAFVFAARLFDFLVKAPLIWGKDDFFLMSLMLIVLFFAGIFNPVFALTGIVLGLIAGYLTNMTSISIASIIGLVIMILFYIWKAGR